MISRVPVPVRHVHAGLRVYRYHTGIAIPVLTIYIAIHVFTDDCVPVLEYQYSIACYSSTGTRVHSVLE